MRGHYRDNNLEYALISLKKIKKLYPELPASYLWVGSCLLNMKKFNLAIEEIDKALKMYPEDKDCQFFKCSCLISIRKFDEADNLNSQLLLNDFKNSYFLFQKSAILNGKGKFLDSIAISKELLNKPKEELAKNKNNEKSFLKINKEALLNNIGFALLSLRNYEEARIYLEESIEINNNFAFAYNNRGFVNLQLGKFQKAIDDIQYSLKLDSDNSYAFKNRGLYYLKIGSKQKALEDFYKAKELGYSLEYGNEVDEEIRKIKEGA